MANIILEQNGVNNTNIDGARFNYFSAGQQNGVVVGALNECVISRLGNQAIISTGELLVSGFRIILEQTEFTFSSYPSRTTTYLIVAEIVADTDENVTFRTFLQTNTVLRQDNIFKNGYGTFQIELGRVVVGTTSIISANRTAPLIKGGIGDGVSGSAWYSGTVVSGTGSSIAVLKTSFSNQIKVNDYYFNTSNSNVYICGALSELYTYWVYLANIKGGKGDSVFIRYSANSDGTDFHEDWTPEDSYIGIALGQVAPTQKTSYEWCRINGVECTTDDTSTSILYTIAANKDKTFKASNITSLELTLPSTVYYGYIAGVNFKSGTTPPTITFINNSSYPLKIMQFGASINSYTPARNKSVDLLIYCDDINVYIYINEV